MTNKIHVEDHTGAPKASEPSESAKAINQEAAAFEERLRGLIALGQDSPIDEKVATAMPTTILTMSITNWHLIAQEVGRAIQMARAAGNSNVETALMQTMEVINLSYKSCSDELDIRIPARATLEEVGLKEVSEEE